MKRDRKSVNDRKNKILAIIREEGDVKVENLAKEFNTSLMTIRRDLQFLEEQNLVRRYYGGAMLAGNEASDDDDIDVKRCRDCISAYAAQFVDDYDTIFINGSMTALNLMKTVEKKGVSLVTNNVRILDIPQKANYSVTLTGGELREGILTGEKVLRSLLEVTAQKTFIGCAAVYDIGAFRYDVPTEIGINETMISRTEKDFYILADHTKIKTTNTLDNFYGFCTYERPWTLITDEYANKKVVERLRSLGKKVIQVPVD